MTADWTAADAYAELAAAGALRIASRLRHAAEDIGNLADVIGGDDFTGECGQVARQIAIAVTGLITPADIWQVLHNAAEADRERRRMEAEAGAQLVATLQRDVPT